MVAKPTKWSAVVFAKNEEQTICGCVDSALKALECRDGHVTAILNGSTDRTRSRLLRVLDRIGRRRLTAFEIILADKANAWNQFIHLLRPEASIYFFVDAYAIVNPAAFDELARAIKSGEGPNAATAVPTFGRSASITAKALRESGGLHGSLYALRGEFVERLCIRDIRIPVGLYRGDGLVGAMALYDLDPLHHPWTRSLVAIADRATWSQRPLSALRPRDVFHQLSRMVRQGRGRMENAVLREVIKRAGFEALPAYADPMIRDWIAEDPERRRPSLYQDLFGYMAYRGLQRWRAPSETELEAREISA